MKFIRQHLNVAALGSNRSAHRDLNERTNQRPRRTEAAGFPPLSPNQRAAPLCALLFELSTNSRLTPSLDYHEVVSCQQTKVSTFRQFGLFSRFRGKYALIPDKDSRDVKHFLKRVLDRRGIPRNPTLYC